ncbi:MAG TPA: hypothetical protein VHU40_07020 [Polyangia bacterium]|nr:hypothetical protein [Polyangia bacterium]
MVSAFAVSSTLAGACGSSGASKGAGGAGAGVGGAAGGTPAVSGAAGGTSGIGGSAAGGATVSAGGMSGGLHLPVTGDAFCLQDAGSADAAFLYGFNRECTAVKKAGAVPPSLDEMQAAKTYCSTLGATSVAACPAETPVAYCVGTGTVPASQLSLDLVRTVYQSPVTPDASAVARNALNVCAGQASMVYDTTGKRITTSCTGTLTASVDGVPTDFSKNLFCAYVSDGTKGTYFIRGSDDPSSINLKTLSIYVFKNAAGLVALQTYQAQLVPTLAALYPAVGYSEGSSGTGAYPTPDPAMVSYQSTTFDATGAGFSGTFTVGAIKGNAGATRTITAGTVNISFLVQ